MGWAAADGVGCDRACGVHVRVDAVPAVALLCMLAYSHGSARELDTREHAPAHTRAQTCALWVREGELCTATGSRTCTAMLTTLQLHGPRLLSSLTRPRSRCECQTA